MEQRAVEQDIAVTFEFLRYLVDHPDMVDRIQDGGEIAFIRPDIVLTESTAAPVDSRLRTIISTKRSFEVVQP